MNSVTRVVTAASAALDRGALRLMTRSLHRRRHRDLPDNARLRLLEVIAIYRHADGEFYSPPPEAEASEWTLPPRCGATEVADLAFPSTYGPFLARYRREFASYRENLAVRARLYSGPGEMRPTVICIHGWGGGSFWREERAFLLSRLLGIGLDVVLFQLPFHGERAPATARRVGSLFPSANVVRTNESFGQAIHELRALYAFLARRGSRDIGVMGMSLGAYTAALWTGLDDRLAFAVAMIPAVSLSELMWRHQGSPLRQRAERAGIDRALLEEAFSIHAPLRRCPQLGRERLLIAAGRGDRITPPSQAEALWEHWNRPELIWFPGGHMAQFGRAAAFRAIAAKLAALDLVPPRRRAR